MRKGWIVALLVVFGLAGIGLVGLGFLLTERRVQVPQASTLVLRFDEPVLEDPPAGARSRLFYRESPSLWDHLRALDRAAEDPRVEAVLLQIDGIDMGWAKTEELREKLLEIQERGKKVIAYIEGGEDQDYVLASSADEIYMAPNTDLRLDGLASYEVFLKGTLDKIGVKADLEHVGEYKSAAEPITHTTMSAPAREAANSLLDETFADIQRAVAESRGLDSAAVLRVLDQGPYTSRQALAAGLVDSLLYPDELEELLPGGAGGTRIELEDYLASSTIPVGPPGAPVIAVVHATGTIVYGKSGTDPLWGRTIGSDSFIDALEEATATRGIRAIVVRVDSPGGEVYASHLMWRAVKHAAEEVPVVASFSDLAASGGYYLAMGADTLVSDAATLTGSIGVVGGKFNFKGLYDKLGMSVDVLSRGQNSLMLSSIRDFTPAERERYLNDMFEEYRTFVGIVAENRGTSDEEIDRLARGRVWTGGQAYENGLVDEIGGIEKSIEVARQMAGLPADAKVRVETFPRIRKTFLQEVVSNLIEEETLDELSSDTRVLAGLSRAWGLEFRGPAQLVASLSRLARQRTLALMPFSIHVR